MDDLPLRTYLAPFSMASGKLNAQCRCALATLLQSRICIVTSRIGIRWIWWFSQERACCHVVLTVTCRRATPHWLGSIEPLPCAEPEQTVRSRERLSCSRRGLSLRCSRLMARSWKRWRCLTGIDLKWFCVFDYVLLLHTYPLSLCRN